MNRTLAPAFDVAPEILARASKVKLLLFDVDGVLTDGRLVLSDDGQEHKAFNSRDGHGIKMLRRNGIEVGLITGRTSKVVEYRAKDLGLVHVYQGCQEKLPVYRQLIAKLKLAPEQTAFVGDDVVDLPIMLTVGLAVAVQNADALTKRHAHWVTPSIGGYTAGREVCDMLLHAHGLYHGEMQRYLSAHESNG